MKRRQVKKLARRGVNNLKLMKVFAPIGNKKIQKALMLYLERSFNEPVMKEPKLCREFWEAFNKLGGWEN